MNNQRETQLEQLQARVEALEAQANHFPGATKMVPVAKVTRDRDETGNYVIVHDTATSPPVADPAPVAGGLVERITLAIDRAPFDEGDHLWDEAHAAILEQAEWLREQGWKEAADLLEQEAGR